MSRRYHGLGAGSRIWVAAAPRRVRQVSPAGLLVDEPIGLAEVLAASAELVSNSGVTETGLTVGRFVCSVSQGLYDGLVNLGCFNCQPAMNSQAIIRPLADAAEVPMSPPVARDRGSQGASVKH